MNRINPLSRSLAVALAAALAACGGATSSGTADTSSSNEAFLSVPRDTAATTAQSGFYLALSRKELGNQWFLSAYMKQYFPGAVSYGAARSLGTKVVSFQENNGKLYVLDASGNKKDSATFQPTLIVDAFPIVHTDAIDRQYPPASYVVFDPAAGLDRFGVVGDAYGQGGQIFQTELKFAQNFSKVADGVVWEQVFEGYATVGDPNSGNLGESNQLRGSGTLGIALRRYGEGKGFVAAPTASQDFFFRGDLKLVQDTGTTTAPFVKWNIYPGMKPITWLISNKVLLTEKAYNGKYDLQGAIKAAVENWNQVFGFKALEAKLATDADSFADDTVNMIIWDTDPSLGYAFANWRQNPITGEIRGASVYINSSWVDDGDQYWPDDQTQATGAQIKRQAPPRSPMLQWQSMPDQSLCKLWEPRFRGDADFAAGTTGLADPTALTKKQKVEQFITHVVLHEIGHTLGLRHNFKGSFIPYAQAAASTSVMDYLLNNDSYPMNVPGPYDADAIKYLYGMAKTEPQQAFCNDSGVGVDPECATFDRSNDPLNTFYAKYYNGYLNAYYKSQNVLYLTYWDYWLNKVATFVRTGKDAATRNAALSLMLSSVSAPEPQSVLQQGPQMAQMIDLVSLSIWNRLYLDPAASRGDATNDPDASVSATAVPQLKGILTNVDGIRGYYMRRVAVDILKKQQTLDAYNALLASRQAIQTARSALSGNDAALTDDLLARIDGATHPYFVH